MAGVPPKPQTAVTSVSTTGNRKPAVGCWLCYWSSVFDTMLNGSESWSLRFFHGTPGWPQTSHLNRSALAAVTLHQKDSGPGGPQGAE